MQAPSPSYGVQVNTSANRPATAPKTVGLFYMETDTGRLYVVRLEPNGTFEWSLVATASGAPQTARLASTANVNTAAPGANLDGTAMVAGDVVLLRAQTVASQNGLWVFNGAATAMTRATSLPAGDIVSAGLVVTVTDGQAWIGSVHVLTTGGTVGTSSLVFTADSKFGVGIYDAGASPVTVNTLRGRVRIAAAAAAVVVNNALCTVDSQVLISPMMNDATALRFAVTNIAAGTFTITANAAATAAVDLNFVIFP